MCVVPVYIVDNQLIYRINNQFLMKFSPARFAKAFAYNSILIWCCLFCLTSIAIAGIWYQLRPPANATLAMAHGQFSVARDYYKAEAELGNPAAMNSLANLYYLGLGVKPNHKLAAELYFNAASQGHAAAQLNLGHLYNQGLGVSYDPVRAYTWYVMSNEHNNPQAELYLTQISQENSLTPLQRGTALEKWSRLPALVAEGL